MGFLNKIKNVFSGLKENIKSISVIRDSIEKPRQVKPPERLGESLSGIASNKIGSPISRDFIDSPLLNRVFSPNQLYRVAYEVVDVNGDYYEFEDLKVSGAVLEFELERLKEKLLDGFSRETPPIDSDYIRFTRIEKA